MVVHRTVTELHPAVDAATTAEVEELMLGIARPHPTSDGIEVPGLDPRQLARAGPGDPAPP